jgi:carboxymethylenebutenolidase
MVRPNEATREAHVRLDTGWSDFASDRRTCAAFRARPAATGARLPGVLLIQEIWGVDEHIQDLTGRVATAGYTALAPDLYSLGGRPAALEPSRVAAVKTFLNSLPVGAWWSEDARQGALAGLPAGERTAVAESLGALFAPRDREALAALLRDAVAALRDDQGCDGRVAAVGWCMGGGLAARLACREPTLAGAAIFYGESAPEDLVPQIACPVIGFYGGEDPRVTDTVPAFAAAMKAAGKQYEPHVYPGAPHAFFNDTRPSYTVDAARDAWARLLTFFAGLATG